MTIELTGKEAFVTDPESEEGRFQNLILNIIGGLQWEDLSEEEKGLCRRNGYDPEKSEE